MKSQTLLVTGCHGFIGSNLALTLQKIGHNVTAVIHSNNHPENLSGFNGVIIEGDTSDPKFWNACDTNFDAVLHQAACTDTTVYDESFMMKQNHGSFLHLLKWAKKSDTDVIYASSAATYGAAPSPQTVEIHEEPLNIYGTSKLEQDRTTRATIDSCSIKIIGLRYFNVYGPRETHKGKMASMIYQLAQQIKAGGTPKIFEFGEQSRDQIYVDDILQANIKSLDAGKDASGIYNVGTGESVSFNDIIENLNRVMGTNLQPEYIPNPYTGKYQDHTQANIESTRQNLGYNPEYTLSKGIDAYFESGWLA